MGVIKPQHIHSSPPTTSSTDRAGISFGAPQSPDIGSRHTIDEAKEIGEILENFGHWVYLRRATDKRCSCWNVATRESRISCPHCTGEGWAYRDIKLRSRRVALATPVTRSTLKQRTDVGMWGAAHYAFYLPATVLYGATADCDDVEALREVFLSPSDRDLIIEPEPDTQGGIKVPVNIEAVWTISQTVPMRGQGGVIKFWQCYVVERALGK